MPRKEATSTSVTVPDDLSPADCLHMLEELHDAVHDQQCHEGEPLTPELKGYLLQLLQHLEGLSRDALSFLKQLDEAIDKLDFANQASKILLRYEISRLPMLTDRYSQKVLDAAHRALDAKPPSPKAEEDPDATFATLGDRKANRPSWGS